MLRKELCYRFEGYIYHNLRQSWLHLKIRKKKIVGYSVTNSECSVQANLKLEGHKQCTGWRQYNMRLWKEEIGIWVPKRQPRLDIVKYGCQTRRSGISLPAVI